MRLRPLIALPFALAPAWATAATGQCTAPSAAPETATAIVQPVSLHAGMPPRPLSAAEIAASPMLIRLSTHGAQLSELPPDHGLRTIFAVSADRKRFQIFYPTPDGQAVVAGVMWDVAGHNVTRDRVAPIAGTIPTVVIDPARPAGGASAALDQIPGLAYGSMGAATAPRLWMFFDPLCPWSTRAMAALQPLVDSGRVRLSLVPISINDHENGGQSTRAAAYLLSLPRDVMGQAWSSGQASRPDADPSADQLVKAQRP